MSTVTGSSAAPADGRAEPGDHLQLQHQQEEDDAERPVDQQRRHVRRGELAGRRTAAAAPADAATGCSTATNAASATSPDGQHGQRHRCRTVAPRTVSDQVSAASADRREHGARHVQAGRRVGSRLSGTCRSATTTTSAASGRLIRNTARQVHSTSQPPRNGPTAPAIPPSPDQAPIAAARSCGRGTTLEIAPGCPGSAARRRRPAAPGPRRAARGSAPARTAATPPRTTTTPITNTRRRPNRSPSEPPSRISEASVRV